VRGNTLEARGKYKDSPVRAKGRAYISLLSRAHTAIIHSSCELPMLPLPLLLPLRLLLLLP
jgi:hypothetical protein